MYALMLATDYDLHLLVSTLSFPGRKACCPCHCRAIHIHQKLAINHIEADDCNATKISSQIQKIMKNYVSNLQHDHIIMVVEAFTTKNNIA